MKEQQKPQGTAQPAGALPGQCGQDAIAFLEVDVEARSWAGSKHSRSAFVVWKVPATVLS